MSRTTITLERVNEVVHHPNADRLDIIQCLGFKVVTGRDQFKVGDTAIYFPADILIPTPVAQDLGVEKYLKHAIYPKDTNKSQCRVSACRIRGIPSHGFVVGPIEHTGAYGANLTAQYGGYKYEPPLRQNAGDAMRESTLFHMYTSIENIQRYPNAIPEGTPVRITEKLHGTNCRIGKVTEHGEVEYMAGSHKVRRKSGTGLYWEFFELVKPLLDILDGDVIVFGEIFGQGVQDMDYGYDAHKFRVFDISVDGKYQDWAATEYGCYQYNVPVVPLLFEGPFSREKVEELTYGRTTFENVKCKFKDREGCVITPLTEQFSAELGGRMILKSVSADYRNRKGAKDIA